MPILDRSDIDTGSPLVGSYAYHPAQKETNGTTAIVHGVCHSGRGFDRMSDELNEHGIGTVLVNLRTDTRRGARNLLTIGHYTDALHAVLNAFEGDNHIRIDSVGGHSMGGRLVQRLQNVHAEWQRPTVLMAPVPLRGTLPMLTRMMLHHPWMVAKTLTFDLRNAMKSDSEIRTLFGDAETPKEVIDAIRAQMTHTSFLTYLQLLLPQHIDAQRQPTLLMMSGTDNLFPPRSYRGIETHYEQLEDTEVAGGHDFFMVHPEKTAAIFAAFHDRHTQHPNAANDDTVNYMVEKISQHPPHRDDARDEG